MGKILRVLLRLAKWTAFAMFGLLMLAASGTLLPFPESEITQQTPYSDFIGREYRVISDVSAYAWNDFPDKEKILAITLMSPPGVKNRFVSWVRPLRKGQTVHIVSAWRQFALFGFDRHYVVLLPGAGLPDGIDIKLRMNGDGFPDPLVFERIGLTD